MTHLLGTNTSPQGIIAAVQEFKDSLTQHGFKKEIQGQEALATVVAAEHKYACDCGYCFIFFACTSDEDEHGPFDPEQINKYRELTGREPIEFFACGTLDYDTRDQEGADEPDVR